MSGHNPHSSSWNHLQVPSYTPRQPQLAHMSNECPIRSPLAWHPNNSAEALYSYMAAAAAVAASSNHKTQTPLDINPLLPFARSASNSMPFGTVDLSLSTAARHSMTPSPRNLVSPAINTASTSLPLPPPHSLVPNSQHLTSIGNIPKTIHKATTSSDTELGENHVENNVMQSDSFAFINEMTEHLANLKSASANSFNQTERDAPTDAPRSAPNNDEPMKLIKESNQSLFYENDNLSPTLPLQHLFSGDSSNIPQNLNELSKSLLSIINNATNPSLLVPPKHPLPSNPATTVLAQPVTRSTSNTSNDDSLDSQLGVCNGNDRTEKKTRCRRRKPQKTLRVSNDSVSSGETKPPSITGNGSPNVKKRKKSLDTVANSSNSIEINVTKSKNAGALSPQTHSIDLSNHSTTYENGKNPINSKCKESKAATNSSKSTNGNGLENTSEINGLNANLLYPIGNYPHANTSKCNPIESFNTADIVKKVEELVKCNAKLNVDLFLTSDDTPQVLKRKIDEKIVDDKEILYSTTTAATISNGTEKLSKLSKLTNNDSVSSINCNGNGIASETKDLPNDTNNRNDLEELPLLPMAEARIPANSTPKQDSSFEEMETNLEKMFSDIDDNNQSSTVADSSASIQLLSKSINEKCSNDATNVKRNDRTADSEQQKDTNSTNSNSHSQTNNKNNDSELKTESNTKTESIPQSSNENEAIASTSQTVQKKPIKRKRVVKRNGKSNGKLNKKKNSRAAISRANSKNNKKKMNGKLDKDDVKKRPKDESMTTENIAKFRGPYIQIQKDGSEIVVNAPITEEIAEKQSKIKKSFVSQNPSDRSKIRGLHVSTLSNKYDAVTTDTSWMCVFCKLGPHKYSLGDLFGPFILSTESDEFQLSKIDPSEDVFRSQRTKATMVQVKGLVVTPAKGPPITSMTAANNTGNSSSKKKRKLTDSIEANTSTANTITNEKLPAPDIFYGMTKVSETAYEVWAHEDCVVWSSGVHIIGTRIIGLEAAVWCSTRHFCSICSKHGAVLSCLQRGCKDEAHVSCAKQSEWTLCEQSFKSRCAKHGKKTDEITNDENK